MYKDYLPGILEDVSDFEKIGDATDPEIAALKENIQSVNAETDASSAAEEGMARFESMLKLSCSSGDTLESRRFRVLSRINNRTPYTLRWLREKLATVFGGTDEFSVSVDYENHGLSIEVDTIHAQSLSDLRADLRKSIPANMALSATSRTAEDFSQYCAFLLFTSDEIMI